MRERQKGSGNDQALIKILANPIRVHALHILNQREASPKELADALDFELSGMSYHVKELRKAGYVELVAMVNGSGRRGGTEHRYIGIKEARFSDEEWDRVPFQMRGQIVAMELAATGQLIAESMESGNFERRSNRHHSLFESVVDEQGWTDAMATLAEAMHRIKEIEGESAERLHAAGDGADTVPMAVSMLGFERKRPDSVAAVSPPALTPLDAERDQHRRAGKEGQAEYDSPGGNGADVAKQHVGDPMHGA